MGTFYLAAAHVNRGCGNFGPPQLVHHITYRSNVSNSIHPANLVKMYVRNRDSMHMAFSLCYQIIDSAYVLLYYFSQIKPGYYFFYISQRAVMVVMVISIIMHMLVFFSAVNPDSYMSSANTALDGSFLLIADSRYAKGIKFRNDSIRIRKKLR